MREDGRALELYFIDGSADGMLTAELFNWTGHVLMFPRTQIREALARSEAKYTGVYLLLGEGDGGEALIYIGESDDVSERIRTHDAKLEWWTNAVIITTSANSLNKAHVKYLESRLIQQAKDVGIAKLLNVSSPAMPSINDAARSNMEAFLKNIFLVLPALRIDLLLKRTRSSRVVDASAGVSAGGPLDSVDRRSGQSASSIATFPMFQLVNRKWNIEGTARLEGGEFVVLKGSRARSKWEGTADHPYARLHRDLAATGALVPHGNYLVFNQDYAFRSPSAAGAVLNGRSTNGQEAWKVAGGSKTYREWEQDRIDDVRSIASAYN